jgi:hypothetical protein
MISLHPPPYLQMNNDDEGYDALVDEFIINSADNDNSRIGNETKNDSESNSNENINANININTNANANDNANSYDNDNDNLYCTSLCHRIHEKNLIDAGQQLRQQAQFERIQKRTKSFRTITASIITSNNITSTATTTATTTGINSERRRRILKTKSAKDENEELIPCRLEFDYDGYRLSDVFLLSSSGGAEECESIATQICLDFDLPREPFQAAIGRSIRDQVEEWNVFVGALQGMEIPFEEIGPIVLRIDIIVNLHRLEDQLEVSLDPRDCNTATMKGFIKTLKSPDTQILGNDGFEAFKPLILHNILEQLMLWRKSIVFAGFHRDARSNALKFHDPDLAIILSHGSSNHQKHISARRHFAHTNTFTPILTSLTAEELEKIEAGRERENRRKRRTAPSSSSTANTTISSSSSKRANTAISTSTIANNLIGTVRSPPRTLPTLTSYRGSKHRITSNNNNSDEEIQSINTTARKRGRKAKR